MPTPKAALIPHCQGRIDLERKLADAVRDQYTAKGEARIPAQIAERAARNTLEANINEHGCKPIA
jgi:hypothetical protein